MLHSLQNDKLTLDQINPFYFPQPLAPLVAARKHNRQIPIGNVLQHIRSVISRISAIENRKSKIENPILLIEGAGGLLSPLGEPNASSQFNVQGSNYYTALDLIHAFNSRVIIVAPNRLGVINHTLLTIEALRTQNTRRIRLVLMNLDPSPSSITHHASRAASLSNPSILTELLSPIPLFRIPYLAKNLGKPEQILQFAKKCKKTLAQILA